MATSARLTARTVQLLCLAGAALWSVGLVIAGFTVSVYSGSESGPGRSGRRADTLVGQNGTGVVLVLLVPLAITLLVGLFVLSSRRWWALIAAGSLTALLALFNLLAMLTIGIFIVPVTAALVIVCLCALSRVDGTHRAPRNDLTVA